MKQLVVIHNKLPNPPIYYSKTGGKYPKGLWGKIITDENKRNEQHFANLIAADGTRYSCLTHATFKMLCAVSRTKHIYKKIYSDTQIRELAASFSELTDYHKNWLRVAVDAEFAEPLKEKQAIVFLCSHNEYPKILFHGNAKEADDIFRCKCIEYAAAIDLDDGFLGYKCGQNTHTIFQDGIGHEGMISIFYGG